MRYFYLCYYVNAAEFQIELDQKLRCINAKKRIV